MVPGGDGDRLMDVVEESHTLAFLQRYASELVNDLEKRAPPFFVTAAKVRAEAREQRPCFARRWLSSRV